VFSQQERLLDTKFEFLETLWNLINDLSLDDGIAATRHDLHDVLFAIADQPLTLGIVRLQSVAVGA
jgi:hypothetical protein